MWILRLGLGLHLKVFKPSRWVILKQPCKWVLHLGLILHSNLQYPQFYLPLPTRILGLCCNTCICTYFYQLEFWGLITILALVHTSTNWDFGASLQYLHLTLILLESLCFCISNFLCLLFGNNNNLCGILDFMCVLNTWCSKNLGYSFFHTKFILKQNFTFQW